jgi:hypothetical protein
MFQSFGGQLTYRIQDYSDEGMVYEAMNVNTPNGCSILRHCGRTPEWSAYGGDLKIRGLSHST